MIREMIHEIVDEVIDEFLKKYKNPTDMRKLFEEVAIAIRDEITLVEKGKNDS